MSNDTLTDENGEPVGDEWAAAMAEQADASGDEQAQAAQFAELMDENTGHEDININAILDVPVTIAMEIGRTNISIRNLLQLNQGSVVELDRLAGEPLDVMVNGTLIAKGEVVVVNEKFGIRLTDVISPTERVKQLGHD
ncbi:MAG: flagellar motor switch protein FliN [Gammaproteobacteria bacterium SHHR-1]|uniref:flagellar motor switch protein FliN n=1 Tax=Magnetovirga frankeli TaxID=947516 RepID=UPI001293D388|nr:flagellar motor switch protein FliN [gamma proteobacterium SS-5]